MPLTSQHCIETPNRPEVEGETRPIRHALAKKRFITKYTETITTLYENFLRSMRAYGDLEFMGVRKFDQDPKGPYVFQTYVQVAERVKFLTSAMHLFKLKEKTKVGIYSINKPEWV